MKTCQIFILITMVMAWPFTAHASVEVLGSLKHVNTGRPGDVIMGEIKVQNSEDKDQEIRVYQSDLLYNFEEYTYYDEPVTHARSNAPWIKFSPKSVIVRGKEIRYIQYEIRIPESDTLNGTFWSVLMIEGVDPIDPEKRGDLNIRTVTRYAIQIVTEIEDKGVGSLKFLEPTLITEGDKLFLAVDLLNNGDHYIAPEVTMELFDDQGESVKVITAPKKGLYPYTSSRFRLDLDGLPGKKTYQAIIIAAGQEDDVFGLEYTLYF